MGRAIPLFLRRAAGALPEPAEVFLHVSLVGKRNLIPADLSAGIGMARLPVRLRGLQRLLAGLRFHGDFSSHVGGAFAVKLAQLAHGFLLLSFEDPLVAFLLACAAAGLTAGALIGAFAAVLAR